VCPDFDGAAADHLSAVGTEFSAAVEAIASPTIAELALAPSLGPEPWRSALQPPADLRRLLAPRSAWAILGLASGEPAFAARVAKGLDAPEASRAPAHLKQEGLIALLPLLSARAGRAWCSVADPAALGRLFDDRRVLASGAGQQPAQLQAYVRASDLPALVDAYGLHAAPSRLPRTVLLRPVTDPWPFADGAAAFPRLVHALDLLELAADGRLLDTPHVYAAWDVIEQHAAQDVRSWYRATRPPRAGSDSKIAVIAPKRALRPVAAAATDADLLAAMLFAIGQPVRRNDLLAASGWTQARLQAAVDSLVAEPPRGQQVMLVGDRLELVAARTASSLVQRLFRHLERGNKVLEPLDLPDPVWLVLAIIILDQPITRAEITARRMADSDRQTQMLLRHRLIREEPRAAVPGRGIPLVTTDLVLQRFGVGWIGDLQHQLLTAAAERELGSNSQTAPA
jgi:chromosome segregation and condensation protein ScpB